MSSIVKEEKYLEGGKAVLLCVSGDHMEKFRLVFRKNEWKEDEWVRIDSEEEGTYLQIRRRLNGVRCEEAIHLLKRVLDSMSELNEVIINE